MDEIIKEFILSGRLDFLEIGMHRFDVQRHFPGLWDHLKRKSKDTSSFLLGSLDLHFSRPFLSSIKIHFNSEGVTLPNEIFEAESIENFPATHREFLAFLKSEAIAYTKVLDKDEQIELSLGNGVYVKFYQKRLLQIRRNPTAAESEIIKERANATYNEKSEI